MEEEERRRIPRAFVDVVEPAVNGVQVVLLERERTLKVPIEMVDHLAGVYPIG